MTICYVCFSVSSDGDEVRQETAIRLSEVVAF